MSGSKIKALNRTLIFGIVFFYLPALLFAQELGGISVKFDRESVQTGDLFALIIEIDREQFAKFDVKFPSHPQLHVVSHESVPTTIVDGRYQQRQRFILQAMSSGELILSGLVIEIIEAGGKRMIEYPDKRLMVLPFSKVDNSDAPAPLPEMDSETKSSIVWLMILILIVLISGAVWIYRKLNQPIENNIEPKKRKITKQDLELIYQQEKDLLSSNLQSELERMLYSGGYSKRGARRLLKQVQDELV